MRAGDAAQSLPFPEGSGRDAASSVVIEKGFLLAREGDLYVVSLLGIALYHFRGDDGPGRYLAMIELVRHHAVSATAVAQAFGIHRVTLQKMLCRFEEQGLAGLFPGKRGKRASKIRDAVERRLLELKARGVSDREAARRLGVTHTGVRSALRRLGYKQAEAVQPSLPMAGEAMETPELTADRETAPSKPVSGLEQDLHQESGNARTATMQRDGADEAASAASIDTDPLNRSGDRAMARLGLLDDAEPVFANAKSVPQAGVLLAIPSLIGSGILDIAKAQFGGLGPAFYGLRTTVVTFLLMALLRIKRAENLKEDFPQNLGRILGLDRAPEMKTVRRKLRELAAHNKGLKFMQELADARAELFREALGYLYIDGHVRVYSGKEKLPKAHVTQRNLCLPATTDYWVNDRDGQPILVITAEANDAMTLMLKRVLADVKPLLKGQRATVIFDRGGWSPKLFEELILDGFDVMTYRKGKADPVSNDDFKEYTGTIEDRQVKYILADQTIALLRGRLKMRQVTRLRNNGKQTQILTNRFDLPTIEVPYRMFARWRQENFFKYMEDEFALDALADYGKERADADRSIPNPQLKELNKQLQEARARQAALEREYGTEVLQNPENKRASVRGFKNAIGRRLAKPLREVRATIQQLMARRKQTPKRVPISETVADDAIPVKLRVETKRISDTFKLVAYQAESSLYAKLWPYYRRSEDEGRTLVSTALQSAADLEVRGEELLVTLAPLSSQHRTDAIRRLCEELNKAHACYPGTSLKLRFAIHDHKV